MSPSLDRLSCINASNVATYLSYFPMQISIYIFFTLFFGPVFAFSFGIIFAITDLIAIWVMHPIIRLLYIVWRYIGSLYRPVIRLLMDPIFESFGQIFRVRNSGSFTERTYRLNISGIRIGGTEAQFQPPAQHQHSS